jgi:hypothetical protein
MNAVKTVITSTIISIMLLSSLSVRAEAVISNDYQAVVAIAFKYFNGLASGDQTLLNESFDMEFGDVKMLKKDDSSQKDIIRTVSLKEFAGFFKKATQDTWQAKVLSVDIVDDKMAMVKLDFTTSKTHYIDYLVMYKRNNHWRIINKTFVAKSK